MKIKSYFTAFVIFIYRHCRMELNTHLSEEFLFASYAWVTRLQGICTISVLFKPNGRARCLEFEQISSWWAMAGHRWRHPQKTQWTLPADKPPAVAFYRREAPPREFFAFAARDRLGAYFTRIPGTSVETEELWRPPIERGEMYRKNPMSFTHNLASCGELFIVRM